MELQITRQDWKFLIVCIGLGILAELSFFHGRVGVSYPIFISGFYIITFLRFRLSFNHRRIGLLLMISIWILSGNYLFYDLYVLHRINLFIIPILVFFHIVLITSPRTFKWGKPTFVKLLMIRLQQGKKYILDYLKKNVKYIFHSLNKEKAETLKGILKGLFIAVPLLVVIIGLLMSADQVFQDIIIQLPNVTFITWGLRGLFIVFASLIFFGVFQVLHKMIPIEKTTKRKVHVNHLTAITILVTINMVYLLFAIIQFKYLFTDQLHEGFTYAEYARRGFFELIGVALLNLTIIISFLKCVSVVKQWTKLTLNALYSVLIGMSGIILISAFQRLSLYEAAYGFTLERILAHAFMIYLMVIFAYTLIRIWLEKLPLLHFYLIIGLIFYTGLNAINLEKIIVAKNIDRYHETEKLDVHYLDHLSSGGVNGLIELYQKNADVEDLRMVLKNRKELLQQQQEEMSWQSFNFSRQKTMNKLRELKFQDK